MRHRDRYTEHRPLRSCLSRHIAEAPSDDGFVDRYAAKVYHENRGAYFTKDQLKTMPWQSRQIIESELARIHGRSSRRERG